MTQFYTNEQEILQRTIDNVTNKTDDEQLEKVYQLANCTKWIVDNDLDVVCLQFPDHMLPDSVNVYKRLKHSTNKVIFILGDTTYESCCVDFVAAQHINANGIIHFGISCHSQIDHKMPVLHINEYIDFDANHLHALINERFPNEEILLLFEDDSVEMLQLQDKWTVTTVKDYDNNTSGNVRIIYMGDHNRILDNFSYFHNLERVYYFDSKNPTAIHEHPGVSKLFKRNYYLVEKLKDARTIGIVVATLAVNNYLTILTRVKTLCRLRQKKTYILSLGRPNVAKLANFPEIDVFVIITCKKNAIFESRDFYKPCVTPFHVELAFNRNFNADQIRDQFDFNEILSLNVDIPDGIDNEPDVSLLSGNVRVDLTSEEMREVNGLVVAVQDNMSIVQNDHFGAGYLAARSWNGLEQNLGLDEVKLVETGREGTAKGYRNETDS